MTDKLTLQDCLKYYKAEIIPADIGMWSGWIKSIDLEGKMLVISLKGYYPEVDMEVPIADCKLTLRDISELTDEEKQHIDKLACFSPIRYIIYESNEYDYSLMEDDLQIFDYLRSINIDIDGFLQSGKAVKG